MKMFLISGAAPLYTNTYLIITEKGNAVVVDPAASAEAYNRILGQENAKLTHIFCTHGHFDHVDAAPVLREQWGATLYCEASDVQGNEGYPLTCADCGYPEGEPIQVDELSFIPWHTPGHTQGSVCILCGNLFFTGDTLFAGDTGRTDLPGGNHLQMVQSCKKLMRLPIPANAQVLPGHDESSTYAYEMANNYFITAMCQD